MKLLAEPRSIYWPFKRARASSFGHASIYRVYREEVERKKDIRSYKGQRHRSALNPGS